MQCLFYFRMKGRIIISKRQNNLYQGLFRSYGGELTQLVGLDHLGEISPI